MHKSLYDIRIDHAALVDELIDSEGDLSPELEMALSINEYELTEKAEAYALRILEFDGQADVVDAEIKRLQKRKESFKKTAERLKETIKAAMIQFDKDNIKTDKVTLSFRKSEVVAVPEGFENMVLNYVKLSAVLDMEKINAETERLNALPEAEYSFPTEDFLQYLDIKAELSKSKMKDALKEGTTIGEVMLVPNKNLQIK
jgi:Gp157 protein